MSDKLLEMNAAIHEARQILTDAESVAERLAELIIPVLRSVSTYELKRMKKELKNFNSHTGVWK